MEDRIKEKYYWEQADKEVTKEVRARERMRETDTDELVFCPGHYVAARDTRVRNVCIVQ